MPGSDTCPLCGLPEELRRKLVWTTDGGIYFPVKRSERLVFLDLEEVAILLEEAVRMRGTEILDTLRERRRAFAREETALQISGIRRAWLRRKPAARRAILTAFREAAFFGCGNISVNKLKSGKEMMVRARSPYHPHLLAGDIWGFWEGFYGVDALVSMQKLTETEFEITVRTISRNRNIQPAQKPPRRPQRDYDLEVCEKCRLPSFPYPIRWDPELGTIYQPGTRRHLLVTSLRGWRLILEEINGSRGEELSPSMGELISDRVAGDYSDPPGGNLKTAYRHFFMGLPFLGWGKPKRVTRRPFLMEAEIEGVPFPQLLSWKIGGVFRALEGEPAEVTYKRAGENTWSYSIGPRLEGKFLPVGRLAASVSPSPHPEVVLPF